MLLKGTALSIRPWAAGDEEDLAHHANDRAVWRNLTSRFPHPYTIEHARTWIAACEARAINPFEYLADVLPRITDHPNARIDELLPSAWAAAQS